MPVAPIALALLKMDQAQDFSKQLGMPQPSQKGKFDAVLNPESEPKKTDSMAISPVRAPQTPLQMIVGSISKTENKLNDIVSLGLSGQQFSQEQLLRMQAGVYKATLTIDVVSKGVEQTTSGLKTVLQSQI